MMLIDDVRSAKRLKAPWWIEPAKLPAWKKHTAVLAEMLHDRRVPVLLVDRLARYYYQENLKETWDLRRDMRNLTPPYSVFWCEHRLPTVICSEIGETVNATAPNGRHGILFFAAARENAAGEDIPPETKWILCGDQFFDYGNGEITGPHGVWTFAVDGRGKLAGRPAMQSFAPPDADQHMQELLGMYYPSLLAISSLDVGGINEFDSLGANGAGKVIEV